MTINSDVTIDESSEDGRASGVEPTLEREPVPPQEDLQILQALRETESEHEEARRSSLLFQKGGIDKVVFGVAGLLTLAFVIWGFAGKDNLSATSQVVLDWVMQNTGWLFVALSSLFVVYVLWLAVSRFGNIPLGKDAEKPEYSMVSWVSMMFAAGMGIGLMFCGVAEPLYH